MPRERIKHGHESRVVYDGDNPVAGESAMPSLDVSWSREPTGWVQIGIDAPTDFLAGIIRDGATSVWTDVLDRREINHMIRTLRRARDAAYGSDE